MKFTDFLTEEIGKPKENTIGELRYCCPFCGERKYKFYVKEDNGQYICFKCEETGNPITFMKKYYHVGSKGAIDLLEGKDIDLEKREIINYDSELTESEKLILMLRGARKDREQKSKKPPLLPNGLKYLKDNFNNPESYPFLTYLYSRGITQEQIIEYSIGYIVNGWCYKSDMKSKMIIKNSVVFFTFNNKGEYIYWNTRSIESNPLVKSINAPSSDNQLGKKDVIFNLNKAKEQPFIVITEGVFDALTLDKYGVATLGKSVSEEQIKLLKEQLEVRTSIYVFLDSDTPEKNIYLASKLYSSHPKTYIVPHDYKDANDLGMVGTLNIINKNRILASPEGIQKYKLAQKFQNYA